MDSKKTNLTPELKEIYDRVMNTAGTPPPSQSTPPSPTLAVPPIATPPSPLQAPQKPTPNPLNPPVLPNTPIPPTLPPVIPAMPEMPKPIAETPQMPSIPPEPSNAEQALSNAPARPVSEGNTFTFNGTTKGAQPATPTTAKPKGKRKISLPIIIALGVVFVIAWGVFWAIILGFIKT